MDSTDDSSLHRERRPTAAMGGTVEPANRAAVAKALFQTPADVQAERYELRDPFAEVTYRASDLAEMALKADQLGSNRFVAIDAQGNRTTISKVAGAWQQGEQHPPMPERPAGLDHERDDESPPARAATQPPADRHAPSPEVIAKIDAQAERAALVARLEEALIERYIIKRAPVTVGDVTIGRTEYRFRGDSSRVAFTESTFRLATDTNSPSVARSMVDVAEARNWRALRISGNEDFRRMVWLEASVRGVKTLGYEPNPADLEVLKREREARLVNRIEPARGDGPGAATDATEKASGRGGGGRKAVLAAIDAVLVAKRVPEKQRQAVLAAATEKLSQLMREGQVPKIKVYDKTAPSHRPVVVPTPEVQRTRERAAPTR